MMNIVIDQIPRGKDYFIRNQSSILIEEKIKEGQSVYLHGGKKFGKSAFLCNLLDSKKARHQDIIYIDALKAGSVGSFYSLLTKQILQTNTVNEVWKMPKQIFSNLQESVQADDSKGKWKGLFSKFRKNVNTLSKEVDEKLKNVKLIVLIDNISEQLIHLKYSRGAEASNEFLGMIQKLRTTFKDKVVFIFSGSMKYQSLFKLLNAEKGLYQLPEIELGTWTISEIKLFTQKISKEDFTEMLEGKDFFSNPLLLQLFMQEYLDEKELAQNGTVDLQRVEAKMLQQRNSHVIANFFSVFHDTPRLEEISHKILSKLSEHKISQEAMPFEIGESETDTSFTIQSLKDAGIIREYEGMLIWKYSILKKWFIKNTPALS